MKQLSMYAIRVSGEFEAADSDEPWTSDIGSARPLTSDEAGDRAQVHLSNGERDVAAVPVPSWLVPPPTPEDGATPPENADAKKLDARAPFGGRAPLIVKLSHGTKLAIPLDVSVRPSRGSRIRVWAWKANSDEWTNPQTINMADVIGPADPKDRRIKKAAAAWKPDGSGPIPRRRPAG